MYCFLIPSSAHQATVVLFVTHICGHICQHELKSADTGVGHFVGRERSKMRCPDCIGTLTPAMRDELNSRSKVLTNTPRSIEVVFDSLEEFSPATQAGLKDTQWKPARELFETLGKQVVMADFTFPEELDSVRPELLTNWTSIISETYQDKAAADGLAASEMALLMSSGTREALLSDLHTGNLKVQVEGLKETLLGMQVQTAPGLAPGEIYMMPVTTDAGLGKTEDRIAAYLSSQSKQEDLMYVSRMDSWLPYTHIRLHHSSTGRFPLTRKEQSMPTTRRLVISDINENLNGSLKEIPPDADTCFFGSGYEHKPREVRLIGPGWTFETTVFARPTMPDWMVQERVAKHYNLANFTTVKQLFEAGRSDWILGYGYNPSQEVLDVHVTSGSYRYFEVKLQTVLDWLASESLGLAYNTKIKGKFDSAKLSP